MLVFQRGRQDDSWHHRRAPHVPRGDVRGCDLRVLENRTGRSGSGERIGQPSDALFSSTDGLGPSRLINCLVQIAETRMCVILLLPAIMAEIRSGRPTVIGCRTLARIADEAALQDRFV